MPPALHFAQINEKDGFFLTGRSRRSRPSRGTSSRARRSSSITAASRSPCSSMPASSAGSTSRRSRPIDAGSTDKMIAAFRKRRGGLHPSAGARAAAARARQGRPHRRLARRCDRPLRVLEPGCHTRLVEDRHGKKLHARLPQGPRLADRNAGRRSRQGGSLLLQGHRSRRPDRPRSPPTRSSATGARTWRSHARPSRRRSTSSSTPS